MSDDGASDERLIPVWIAFAGHFLDSETRHEIPVSALRAVEAGLTPREARRIWRRDVAPVVGPNLLCMPGEWGGWDEAWLVERIRAVRRRKGILAWLERLGMDVAGVWPAIEGCMEALQAAAPERRRGLARDLGALACHFFDLRSRPFDLSSPGRREALEALFRERFLPLFRDLVYPRAGESRERCERRVERALALGGAWRPSRPR